MPCCPRTFPHSYALKPSDIRQLSDAELFVWVGPAWGVPPKDAEKHRPPDINVDEAFALHAPTCSCDIRPSERKKRITLANTLHTRRKIMLITRPATSIYTCGLAASKHSKLPVWSGSHLRPCGQMRRLILTGESLPLKTPWVLYPRHSHWKARLVSHHNGSAYLMADLNLTINEVVVTQTDLTPGAQHFGELRDADGIRPIA